MRLGRAWGLAWTPGLVGQAALVLLLAVVLESLGASILHRRAETTISRVEQARHLAEQLVALDVVLTQTPEAVRPLRAQGLSTRQIKASWTPIPPLASGIPGGVLRRTEAEIVAWRPALANRDLRLGAVAEDPCASIASRSRRPHRKSGWKALRPSSPCPA